MLYIIEYGQPCQGWGCPQMTSALAREIIPFGKCSNNTKVNCNCCYDCWRECSNSYDKKQYDEWGEYYE